jgi:hydrogenase nickel incorporation protein HypB
MSQIISVGRDVLAEVKQRADEFRQAMLNQGTLVVHLLSSPGAGKTSLLSATAQHRALQDRVAVLVGDIATDRDARRLSSVAPVVQLTTGGACHLEYSLVERGWNAIASPGIDFLFIENVGNLVCPASHDLGEHIRVVMLSTTEGDDKPAKYPKAFRTSHALVINKTDLLPYVPFSVEAASTDARLIQPRLEVFALSALNGEGIDPWCNFLAQERQKLLGCDE